MAGKKHFAVICIPGYNVDDYRESTGKVAVMLAKEGIYTTSLPYKADTVTQARKKNPDLVERLQERYLLLKDAGYRFVAVLAHSNGNAALRMCFDKYQTPFDVTFNVQPALPSKLNPYPSAKCHVFWNEEDDVVRFGKWLTFLTRIISDKWATARNWGEMGRTCYTGEDKNVLCINTIEVFQVGGHSGIFR